MKSIKAVSVLVATLFYFELALADKKQDEEKAKWIADTQKMNQETLKKVNPQWVSGCLSGATRYVAKYRKINDGTTPQYNAENICMLISDEEQVKAHIKVGKDLKHLGCVDGIGMSMQMFDREASNQKRKEVMIEYCM